MTDKKEDLRIDLFIVAGNAREYREVKDELISRFKIPKEYIHFVNSFSHIAGYNHEPSVHVLYAGTYWTNPIFDDFFGAARLLELGMPDTQDKLMSHELLALQALYANKEESEFGQANSNKVAKGSINWATQLRGDGSQN